MSTELKLISEKELALIDNSFLNVNQLQFLHKFTPAKYIRERPAKGGGKWKYISGGYVKKTLNMMFGFDWDFEIIDQMIMHNEAIVKGKLTVRSNGRTITKMQFGNKDIVYKKLQEGETERVPLSIGNDLKSACTDALKKCASELGIGADIYNKEEFEMFAIYEENEEVLYNTLIELFDKNKTKIVDEKMKLRIIEIIEKKEESSYQKVIDYITKLIS